jgi:uncharacterized protein (DUF1015 family)
MAIIKPFKASRPTRDKVNLVASRPFYTYKKNVLGAKLESNKYSFLHVINPEFNKKDRTQPNSVERFQKVREKYEEFCALGYFIKDTEDSFYLYRQQTDEFDFLGLICGVSVEEYRQGKIKIHEHTLTQREETFKTYLEVCKFNAEPVLLTYQDSQEINRFLNTKIKERSEYEFTTTDGIKHDLWLVNDTYEISLLQQYFSKIDGLYIADGHHRSASSVRYAASQISNPKAQYFLAFLIGETRMKIFEYNRIITSLNGLTHADFLNKLEENFTVTLLKNYQKPSAPHQMVMVFQNQYYTVAPKTVIVDADHPIKSLDTQILADYILQPILGINDPKSDPRLHFIEGTKSIKDIVKSMQKSNAPVAFQLFPVTVEQLKRVADTNNIMPPKSTWVEPKMRSGLTIYEY